MNAWCVISGAGSGIGAATAQLLSEMGWNLILIGRSLEKLQSIQNLVSASVQTHTLVGNLQDEKGAWVSSLTTLLARLDTPLSGLVNCAGSYLRKPTNETTLADWKDMIGNNLYSAVTLTNVCWPYLKKAQGSSIINVSSTLGLRPVAMTSAYSAAKAAMINWTEALALEGAPFQIRANAVCPGIVDTPMHSFHNQQTEEAEAIKAFASDLHPLGRLGTAQEVAEAIEFLLASKSRWTTGSILKVDGGIHLTSKG